MIGFSGSLIAFVVFVRLAVEFQDVHSVLIYPIVEINFYSSPTEMFSYI